MNTPQKACNNCWRVGHRRSGCQYARRCFRCPENCPPGNCYSLGAVCNFCQGKHVSTHCTKFYFRPRRAILFPTTDRPAQPLSDRSAPPPIPLQPRPPPVPRILPVTTSYTPRDRAVDPSYSSCQQVPRRRDKILDGRAPETYPRAGGLLGATSYLCFHSGTVVPFHSTVTFACPQRGCNIN